MDVIKLVETFGASLLICLILLKQMDKREESAKEERKEERERQYKREDEHDKAQRELLNTNRTLANTVEELTRDVKQDLDTTKDTVIKIADKLDIFKLDI